MRDKQGFDLWADDYDKVVGLSYDEKTYPFAGYKEVLSKIYRAVTAEKNAVVLDLGFGTGTLTAKLYEHGCEVWGQDFSDRMIEKASEKMPEARLFRGDFSQGLVEPLLRNSYDFIIATYALHHLPDDGKIKLINVLLGLLKRNGKILIGDVAFPDRQELLRCREKTGEQWDDDEFYFVYDEIRKSFPKTEFERFSFCAGVLSLSR